MIRGVARRNEIALPVIIDIKGKRVVAAQKVANLPVDDGSGANGHNVS
jgi:hypothetical protein